MHFRRAALGTLPLEQPQRGGRQLRGVEFPEQGLERNHFAGWNSLSQYGAQLLPDRFLAIPGTPLRSVQIERSKSPRGELAEPRHFARGRQRHDLNGLHGGNSLQLGGCDWRLVEDDGMCRRASQLAADNVDGLVVLMVAERSQRVGGFGGGQFIARDNDR